MSTMFKWWVFVCCVLGGGYFINSNGLFASMWLHDLSHMSTVSLTVFGIMTSFIGFLTYQIHVKNELEYLKYVRACKFSAVLLMGLGMIGTLIGFMLMFNPRLSAMAGASSTDDFKPAILQLANGLSTAVTATLVGLTCSMLVQLQLVNLEVELEELDTYEDANEDQNS